MVETIRVKERGAMFAEKGHPSLTTGSSTGSSGLASVLDSWWGAMENQLYSSSSAPLT